MSSREPAITGRCPICDKPASLAASNPWRPFCSRRCRLIDLGEWMSDGYAVPGESAPPDESDVD